MGHKTRQNATGEWSENVGLPGTLVTLLAATTVTTDATTSTTAVTGLDTYTLATVLLTVAGKTMDASTTMDVYVQYSPNGGTTWDDIAHFAQITNAAIGNGTYVLFLNALGGSSAIDRATTNGTLAANTVRNVSWCDRLRIQLKSVNFAGADTITLTVSAFMQ